MESNQQIIKTSLVMLFIFIVQTGYGVESKHYNRPAHNEVCYTVKDFEIKCGDFTLMSTIFSKKYDTVSSGDDVLASFSAKHHPGDHPFLKRLAKTLWVPDVKSKAITNQSAFQWNKLKSRKKNKIIKKYSSIGQNPESKKILVNYLHACIDYWVAPEAIHDERKQEPTLSEVAALCMANSGMLPEKKK